MALISSTSNVHPILDTNKYYGHLPTFQINSPNAVADPDAGANNLWEELAFWLPESLLVNQERSIQEPEVTSKRIEGSGRMLDKLKHLWEGLEDRAYKEVRSVIFKRWTTSAPRDKQFLEKAVDLLAEFQKQPMRNIKDSWEWLEHLKTFGIDSKKYLTWVDEQYELLAREKRKAFDDITLEKAFSSLIRANWKDANDESAIMNAYLMNTEASLKPDVYLGPLGNSHLALRVNCECVKLQVADSHTVESLGVTTINPNILLGLGFLTLKKRKSVKLLFIPIGNIFRIERSGNGMNASTFREGKWQDTGIVLILRIMEKKGTPGDFYMVKDLRSSNANVDGEDDALLWKSLETKPFTLARMDDKTNHLKPSPSGNYVINTGLTERPPLKLKRLSVSKLEIVQTGEKGDWSEGYPPVGLYPDLGND